MLIKRLLVTCKQRGGSGGCFARFYLESALSMTCFFNAFSNFGHSPKIFKILLASTLDFYCYILCILIFILDG